MVLVEFESKPEMPTIALIPIEQVAYIVPVPTQTQLDSAPATRGVVLRLEDIPRPPEPPRPPPPPPSGPTEEEAKQIRAEHKAKYGPAPGVAAGVVAPEIPMTPASGLMPGAKVEADFTDSDRAHLRKYAVEDRPHAPKPKKRGRPRKKR